MIELQRVYKRYPGQSGRALLDHIDLHVESGDVVLLSGPGGAGKSTLLGLLYGACFATSGTVSVFGRDVARLRRSSIALLRRCVGVVPQRLSFMFDRSVFDNVAIVLEAQAESRKTIRARTMRALENVGLAEQAGCPITRLSAGQQQWVAIARALVGEPGVLIADEPTAYLDPRDRDRFIDMVGNASGRGVAAIIATNDHKLLCAGARHGWRHVELRDGALEVVADRQPETQLSPSQADSQSLSQAAADSETAYPSIQLVQPAEAARPVIDQDPDNGPDDCEDAIASGSREIYAGGAFGAFEAIDAIDAQWTIDVVRSSAPTNDRNAENRADAHRADAHRAAENVVPFPRAAAGGIAE